MRDCMLMVSQVVTTITSNPRAKMQAASLAAAKNYEKDALDRIRRIGIISAELEVKQKQKNTEISMGHGVEGGGWTW